MSTPRSAVQRCFANLTVPPQSRLMPCQLPRKRWSLLDSLSQTFGLPAPSVREPFGFAQPPPKSFPRVRGKWHEVPKGERLKADKHRFYLLTNSYIKPALKGEVANEVRRRGYKEACSSLSVSTPQSRLMPCQLPGRGAFWLCVTAAQKLSPFTGKVARSAERGAAWRSLLALCNHPISSPYNTPPHTLLTPSAARSRPPRPRRG